MDSIRKFALAAVAALCLAIGTTANAQEAQPQPPAPPKAPAVPPQQPRKMPQPPNAAQRQQELTQRTRKVANDILKLYDENKDGKLDAAEYAKMEKEMEIAAKLQTLVRLFPILKEIDTNRDMVISDEEAANIQPALRKQIMQNRQRRMNPPPKQPKPAATNNKPATK